MMELIIKILVTLGLQFTLDSNGNLKNVDLDSIFAQAKNNPEACKILDSTVNYEGGGDVIIIDMTDPVN